MSEPKAHPISSELAQLGEPALGEDELAWLDGGSVDATGEVASVALLHELAEPQAFEDLSELEAHRVWRNVEGRLESPRATRPSAAPATSHSGGHKRWLLVAVGMAAAAVVALIVVPRDDSTEVAERERTRQAERAEQAEQMAEQAHAALALIDDGRSDRERAEAAAREYQRRLEQPDQPRQPGQLDQPGQPDQPDQEGG